MAPAIGGKFHGDVVAKWLVGAGPDRDMELTEDFAYVDPAGKEWSVPAGAVINGASIPRLFWRSVGPPYVGNYRRASVVHDHHVDIKQETWQAVHKMFHDACLTGGVSRVKAKLMYAAVTTRRWTPQDSLATEGLSVLDARTLETLASTFPVDYTIDVPEAELEAIAQWIEDEDPPLDAIEKRVASAGSQRLLLPRLNE